MYTMPSCTADNLYSMKCTKLNENVSVQTRQNFQLKRSAIFMTEFRAWLKLGARNFHLKPCMFTWAKIGSYFEINILVVHSKVSSYHLTYTEFLITK